MYDDKVLKNVLANINPAQFQTPSNVAPQNYSANAGIKNVMQNLNSEPGGWWEKTKDFFGSPTGRSLGAGLLTGGLVAATGGNGLEALSYGAQSGGTAAKVNRSQYEIEAKRQLEDKYFSSKLAEQQADREARQQELSQKTANDWALAKYNYDNGLQKMYKENEFAFNRTLQTEKAKNIAELEKGANAMERMRPSVEDSLKRAKESLASGDGLGLVGGNLAYLGLNATENAGANYANIESANAQMNALLRQRLQATGLTGSELNSALEANAYRYTISPTDAESVVLQKIGNFEKDYLKSNVNNDPLGIR